MIHRPCNRCGAPVASRDDAIPPVVCCADCASGRPPILGVVLLYIAGCATLAALFVATCR